MVLLSLQDIAAGGLLEPTTEQFIQALAASGAPRIYTLSIADARNVLDTAQSTLVRKLPAHIEDRIILLKPSGEMTLRDDRTAPVGPTAEISLRIIGSFVQRTAAVSCQWSCIFMVAAGSWVINRPTTA